MTIYNTFADLQQHPWATILRKIDEIDCTTPFDKIMKKCICLRYDILSYKEKKDYYKQLKIIEALHSFNQQHYTI